MGFIVGLERVFEFEVRLKLIYEPTG